MLTGPRRTEKLATDDYGRPMAADVSIYQGAIVVLDADGNARPGAAGAYSAAVGVAKQTAFNSGGAAGNTKALVERGIFLFDTLAADPVTSPMVGENCFVADDHTVAGTDDGGARPMAGKVFAVEPNGVWVAF